MALGITPADLRVSLLGQGLIPIAAGAVPGIAGAVLSGRLLESLVDGAKSVDATAYAATLLFYRVGCRDRHLGGDPPHCTARHRGDSPNRIALRRRYCQGRYAAPYRPASFPSVAFAIRGLVAREESALNFAMDLTPLVEDAGLDPAGDVLELIDRFRADVERRVKALGGVKSSGQGRGQRHRRRPRASSSAPCFPVSAADAHRGAANRFRRSRTRAR